MQYLFCLEDPNNKPVAATHPKRQDNQYTIRATRQMFPQGVPKLGEREELDAENKEKLDEQLAPFSKQ